jgi:hypothetical protein
MCLLSMAIGSVGCAADPAVLVAAEDGPTAEPAPARIELTCAWAIGVVVVAAVGVLGDPSPEHIASSLERGELRVDAADRNVELSNSCS